MPREIGEVSDDDEVRSQSKVKHILQDGAGNVITSKQVVKFYRDTLCEHLDYTEEVIRRRTVRKTTVNLDDPLAGRPLVPSESSPICQRCQLNELGARNPYMAPIPAGLTEPDVLIVTEGVSRQEDRDNVLAAGTCRAHYIRKYIEAGARAVGLDPARFKWATLTRCAPARTNDKKVNLKTHGNYCRNFLVDEILRNPPKLIVPVGSTVLGMLCHKSNAQDWSGKVLTYRGWPDDWLTDPNFVLPKQDKKNPEVTYPAGHPLFGHPPDVRIPMIPIQSPGLVIQTRNPQVITRWKKHIALIVEKIKTGIVPPEYDRPWFRITNDPGVVERELQWLIDNPGTLVTWDTETTGLEAWVSTAAIVFHMFRWNMPDGTPRCIGFPWKYDGSPLLQHLDRLAPTVLAALYASRLRGHNLTFDILYTYATMRADLEKLTWAMHSDTWHMAYTLRQQRGSLGLDMIAYDWVPEMAGYEENLSLLIDLHGDLMNPGNKKGGHYANCPVELWDTHFRPYVMGDVEVCHLAGEKIDAKLERSKTYKIPLAHTEKRGTFRWFQPPNRKFVYDRVMSESARVMTRIMGRGLHVDTDALERQEDMFPKQLVASRDKIKTINEKIISWVEQKEATIQSWELDLENKDQLKELLFTVLQLDIQRLTPAGRKLFDEDHLASITFEEKYRYAACDKYTLNRLAVDHPELRPLQEYRKQFKQYTGYIKPMRNVFNEKIDKKRRTDTPLLMPDGKVHASFLLTGTRGGRLSCRNPNLQQLPRDGMVKRIYTSRYGDRGCMYQGDLSQIELRLLAAACGDPAMVKAYWDGIDLHSLTTSRIFNTDYDHYGEAYTQWLQKNGRDDEVKKLGTQRRIGKGINFLTGYGGGAFGLQTTLAGQGTYLSLEECERHLENFFDSYPTLRAYLSSYKKFIEDHGVAVSILGRVRIFEEVFSDDREASSKALRAGCNHLIQSTASDMMLICLAVIENVMRVENLESILVSTVHDSLLIDAVREELPIIHEIVTGVVNNIPDVFRDLFGPDYDLSWMIVPFSGDCEVGPNYHDQRKIPSHGAIDWDYLLSAKHEKKAEEVAIGPDARAMNGDAVAKEALSPL